MSEVRAEMVANVWKVLVTEGAAVADGDTLLILEEIPVVAEAAGTVSGLVAEGSVVQEGDLLATIG